MAVYAISDVHGALDELDRLIRKTGIRFDGSDSLYLLGDFGDWGEKSIEALLYVKQLDCTYPFVHCAMGNHELMFLNTALSAGDQKPEGDDAENWLLNNRGLVTWQGYEALSREEQQDLLSWMQSLRFSYDVNIGTLTFMLAHAYPYYYDCEYPEEEAKRRRQEAVWRRLLLRENPFAEYDGSNHYDYLVCGHTISEFYFQQLRVEQNWHRRMPSETIRNRIFRGENFIDIDCGAKCMDVEDGASDARKMAALRAQLACLRLDDMEGFYVHRPVVRVPDLATSSVTQVKLPEVKLPEVKLPELKFPELRLPDDISFQDVLQEMNTNARDAWEDPMPDIRRHRKG